MLPFQISIISKVTQKEFAVFLFLAICYVAPFTSNTAISATLSENFSAIQSPANDCEEKPLYYNHNQVISSPDGFEGYCVVLPDSSLIPDSWPGCEFCCSMGNPQWLLFIAGGTSIELDVLVSECSDINLGIQIGLYEIPCGTEFDTSQSSPGLLPTPEMLVSSCNLTSAPQNGEFTLDFSTIRGQTYGIVFDGWTTDHCTVEILNVKMDSLPPNLGNDSILPPTFDKELFAFDPDSNTICLGARDLLFYIPQVLNGVCEYVWTVTYDWGYEEILPSTGPSQKLSFFNEGQFEICVQGFGLHDSTEISCNTFRVREYPPEVTYDTITSGENYIWINEASDTIKEFTNLYSVGEHEFSEYLTTGLGCRLKATLFLTIVPRVGGSCNDDAPYFYNHAPPACDNNDREDLCIEMGPPFPPAQIPWPGVDCSCCSFHNPQWVTFVAKGDELNVELFISDCANNQGVQLALFELDCDVDFDPFMEDPGMQPLADQSLTNCTYAASPNLGFLAFDVETEAGKTYGLVFDGWANDVCRVEIQLIGPSGDSLSNHVIEDLEPPVLSEEIGFGFMGDTLCRGAQDIPFQVMDSLSNTCHLQWTLSRGNEIDTFIESSGPMQYFSFPDTGHYEICVQASNFCYTTPEACRSFYVAELDSAQITYDTILNGNTYDWHGPFGEVILQLPEQNEDGDLVLDSLITNDFGCSVDTRLFLHVTSDYDCSRMDAFSLEDSVINSCTEGSFNLQTGPEWRFYQWSTGSTDSEISVSETGFYAVTVTDVVGCTASDSTLVNIIDFNIITEELTICKGQSLELVAFDPLFDAGSGEPDRIYEWSTGDSTQRIEVQPDTTATYYATVTQHNWSCVDSITIQSLDSLPVAICEDVDIYLGEDGLAILDEYAVGGKSTAFCGEVDRFIDQYFYYCGETGSHFSQFTITDQVGDTATCEAVVTVRDTLPPTIFCPEEVVVELSMGERFAFITDLSASANDNCHLESTFNSINHQGLDASGRFAPGQYSILFAATDPSGNYSECHTELTVHKFQDITTDPDLPPVGPSPFQGGFGDQIIENPSQYYRSKEAEEGALKNKAYVLFQNEPNPFLEETVIPFQLPEDQQINLQLIDSRGNLISEEKFQGKEGLNRHRIQLDHIPNGVIFYRLITENWSGTKKMIKQK